MNRLGRGERQKRLGRPQSKGYRPAHPRYMLSNCQTASGWAVAYGCTLSNPSRVMGDGCTRTPLTMTATGANTVMAANLTFPATSAAGYSGIKLRIRIKPGGAYSELTNNGPACVFYLLAANGTDYIYWDVQLSQHSQEVILPGSQITAAAGSGAWLTTSFTTLRVRQNAVAGYTSEVVLEDVEWVAGHDPGVVVFAFDDIGTTVYDVVYPIMAARGLVGTNGVITDAIGSPTFGGYDRMTAAELLTLKAAGWDYAGHSGTHGAGAFLSTSDQATCEPEVDSSRDAILANAVGNGVCEGFYWPPGGVMQSAYSLAMVAQGMKLCRATGLTGAQTRNVQGGAWVRGFDNGLVHVVCLIVANTTATAFIQGHIDCVVATGGILVLLFHHVDTDPADDPTPAIGYSTANFTTIADYVKTRVLDGRLRNLNFTQVFQEFVV